MTTLYVFVCDSNLVNSRCRKNIFLSKGIIKLDVDSCKSNLQAVSSTLNMLIQAMIF